MSWRMHQRTCWCAICGVRFWDSTEDVVSGGLKDYGDLPPQPWLEEVVLLSAWQDRAINGSLASESAADSILEETTSQDGIHMIKAAAVEVQQNWFQSSLISFYRPYNADIDENGQIVDAYGHRIYEIRKAKINFPVHSACLSLAKRLMEVFAKGQSNTLYGGPKSMRQLWDILLSRFWYGCPIGLGMEVEVNTAFLHDPHNHYLEHSFILNCYPIRNFSLANPIKVSGITDYVLSLLHPVLKQGVSPEQSISKYMAQIAPELKLAIVDSLLPLRNLPLQCTRLLDQSYWKEMLMSGRFLPYLWDLDLELLEAKASQLPEKVEWDWERLIRQLSQSGFLDYIAKAAGFSNFLPHVPYGLRNRRRIWRILEEMKLDDMKRRWY